MACCLTCCVADAICCATSGAIECCCCVIPCKTSVVTRVLYALGFTLATAAAFTLKTIGFQNFPYFCDQTCWQYVTVYRFSFSLVQYHSFLMLLTFGVTNSRDARARIQNGFWPIKFILFAGVTTGSFFMEKELFDKYYIPAFVFSGFFLLLQMFLLVDFAYAWANRWVSNYEETQNSAWQIGLVGSTILIYCLVLTGHILLYHFFGYESPRCGLNIFLISFNLILTIIQSILSIHPRVQEKRPKSGLLQAGVIALYSTYLIASAITNDPYKCLRGIGTGESDPNFQNTAQIVGVVLSILALGYTAIDTGSSYVLAGQENQDDETEGTLYSYSYFHLVFALASFYMASTFTNWNVYIPDSSPLNSPSNPDLTIDRGEPAYWIKASTSWVVVLLYIWTLVAPLVSVFGLC
ncbi:serine incorporator/TMS membrane protein [Paraphysoderma sedebokerense]|nr:serine incorporator/TMS membrane protein [Paraphysoderma sedebokerense]